MTNSYISRVLNARVESKVHLGRFDVDLLKGGFARHRHHCRFQVEATQKILLFVHADGGSDLVAGAEATFRICLDSKNLQNAVSAG
jgi:hypothetical protein